MWRARAASACPKIPWHHPWLCTAPQPFAAHVRAHSGIPGNEAADLLAEMGRQRTLFARTFAAAFFVPQWLPAGCQLSRDIEEEALSHQFWLNVFNVDDPAEVQPRSGRPATRTSTLRLATANVLTMRPAEEAAQGFSTRRLQLEDAFFNEDLDIIGI